MAHSPTTQRIKITGPLVVIGFGSIGRGLLPLIEKTFDFDRNRFVYIDPSDTHADILAKHGVRHIQIAITEDNYREVLTPLLTAGEGQGICVQVAIDVDSIDLIKLCRELNTLYVDASIEPWLGFYRDTNLTASQRSVYALRENMLAEKKAAPHNAPTAVTSCGANPGLVSWLTKQALLNLARDLGIKTEIPQTRIAWAQLMQKTGVKGIHIAERDTQVTRFPKPLHAFANTWSSDGMIDEATQPAELGWGTHEKWMPPDGNHHDYGCQSAIYLLRAGGSTRVRSWCPTPGPQVGFLVAHHEAASIADYFTVGAGRTPEYRPTCHYAYHPCNHAVLSLHEFFGNGIRQEEYVLVGPDDIVHGADELGVLLYGHAKNAYWFGSHLTNEQAIKNAPYQNATGMQVSSGVLAGMVWAVENPQAGVVEPEDMDFERCLEVQTPYLGEVFGTYTDWTPLHSKSPYFPEDIDTDDPWQFRNVLVRQGVITEEP